MPRRASPPGPAAAPRETPVRPGSPLYRLLEMIARAVATADTEKRSSEGVDADLRKE